MRWDPIPIPAKADREVTFVEGISTVGGAGDPASKSGLSIYLFAFNTNMSDRSASMYNADGEWLIVPQQGALRLQTEMGFLEVEPNEIVVVPRGVKFLVDAIPSKGAEGARGYILEVFESTYESVAGNCDLMQSALCCFHTQVFVLR